MAGEQVIGRRTGARAQRANGRETREMLLDAALSIWSEAGLEAVTMNAVGARAGVTRGAVYHHFADRGDLIVAVQSHLDDRLLSLFDEAAARRRDPYLLVAGIAANSPELLRGYLFGLINRDPRTDRLIGAAIAYFRDVQRRGGLHPHANPEHAAVVAVSTWIAAMLAVCLRTTPAERQAEARAFAGTFREIMEGAFIDVDALQAAEAKAGSPPQPSSPRTPIT